MGYLHAGHLSLIQRARRAVGRHGLVVVSIYVNPTQFGPAEDLARYPRDFAGDARLCRAGGVDVIFRPTDETMYPGRAAGAGGYSTYVIEEQLARGMEGGSRPHHFRGVTTVVAKLFNLALPTVTVFGAKDYQQAAIVRRMIRDLNFPVKLMVAPTTREKDGLAMSSRNKYLTPTQRAQAPVLGRAISLARATVRSSRRALPAAELRRRMERLMAQQSEARVDYIEFFHPETLVPLPRVTAGAQVALAVYFGKTRLIDNGRL
jgi:pantoate--beta-alanine ligase